MWLAFQNSKPNFSSCNNVLSLLEGAQCQCLMDPAKVTELIPCKCLSMVDWQPLSMLKELALANPWCSNYVSNVAGICGDAWEVQA